MTGHPRHLDIAGSMAHGALREATALFLSEGNPEISSVALITHLDEIHRLAPNSVVVLSSALGSGGWLVSAALRRAWERRASAVIVSGSEYSSSATRLADRLDITLFAVENDTSRIALALATEIGANSFADTALARLATAAASATTLTDVMLVVSAELGGAEVLLEYDGVTLHTVGGTRRGPTDTVSTDVLSSSLGTRSTLTVKLPAAQQTRVEIARSLLTVARPAIEAAWLQGDQGTASPAALFTLDEALAGPWSRFTDRHRDVLRHLGWRPGQHYVAVSIRRQSKAPGSSHLTSVVRLLWRAVDPRDKCAPVETDTGWVALLPVRETEDTAALAIRIRTRIGAALQELGMAAGLSGWRDDPDALAPLIHEARVAAAVALSTRDRAVIAFPELDLAAAAELLDRPEILLVAELALPHLMAHPDRDTIVEAVKAYLDHHGSVALAAESLTVHRNTLQARLAKARAVGIPIDDPDRILAAHIVCSTLHRRAQATSENPIENG